MNKEQQTIKEFLDKCYPLLVLAEKFDKYPGRLEEATTLCNRVRNEKDIELTDEEETLVLEFITLAKLRREVNEIIEEEVKDNSEFIKRLIDYKPENLEELGTKNYILLTVIRENLSKDVSIEDLKAKIDAREPLTKEEESYAKMMVFMAKLGKEVNEGIETAKKEDNLSEGMKVKAFTDNDVDNSMKFVRDFYYNKLKFIKEGNSDDVIILIRDFLEIVKTKDGWTDSIVKEFNERLGENDEVIACALFQFIMNTLINCGVIDFNVETLKGHLSEYGREVLGHLHNLTDEEIRASIE